jgi:hypothetical protein
MMRWGIPALAFSLCACVTAPDEKIVPWHGRIPLGQTPEVSAIGYCRSEGQITDLRRMMVLETQRLDIAGEQGRPIRVELEGESVRFERLDGDRSSWSFNIGHIADSEEHLDVELKLARVENQLAVYWRETSQRRIYRQGLLRVVGDGLVRWCEGRGGVYRFSQPF